MKASLLVSILVLAVACDGKSAGESKTAASKAPAKPADAEAPKKTDDAKDEKKSADPHAGLGMKSKPEAPPKGPPRDIKPSGEVTEEAIKELKVSVPKEWEKGQPSGMMRMAQWVLPGPGGDAELVVYRFAGGAGGVEANIERWKGQFQPPEGKSIDDMTKVEKFDVGALKVTHVDIAGRFVAAVMPGQEAKHDEADYRMLATILEGSGDPFFFKATGPQKTIDLWAEAYMKMLRKPLPVMQRFHVASPAWLVM
jgi:hypothetical protein